MAPNSLKRQFPTLSSQKCLHQIWHQTEEVPMLLEVKRRRRHITEADLGKQSSCPVKRSKIGPNEYWTGDYQEVAKMAQKIHNFCFSLTCHF